MPEDIKALMRSDEPFAMPYIKILPSENTLKCIERCWCNDSDT